MYMFVNVGKQFRYVRSHRHGDVRATLKEWTACIPAVANIKWVVVE
jgi:hypothetical protein